ncbi:AlpA family phage regulatory protein [Burkholderia pseudomallei]|uniref:helix-turn-helix transcriptional regulator n=1 Tax=Burkholderia pseudomallei TaxID=28450 RepID=UPI0021164D3E|nr:AlpA family phage regulatory protein [Burkholderia pseudomallei]MCQ8223563.1 AlpA family phage regulatory protein [Burkholderia pseudomallei]
MVAQKPLRFLRAHEVTAKTGLSRSAIYAEPGFPKPVKISAKASAWVESELEFWMAARMASRGQK